jgi:hypothetical protein
MPWVWHCRVNGDEITMRLCRVVGLESSYREFVCGRWQAGADLLGL